MFNFMFNWFRKQKCAEILVSLTRMIFTLTVAKPLRILHRSQHFVVVEKDFDVFTNNEIGKKVKKSSGRRRQRVYSLDDDYIVNSKCVDNVSVY